MTTRPPAQPAAAQVFKKHFGFVPPHAVRVPGRLELLGNHTDYNGGLVMSVAVDRYLEIAASPRNDGRIELFSSAFPNPVKFSVSTFEKDDQSPWANYLKGVLAALRKREVFFGGFNAAIDSTIPAGSGLSSSAALELATALIVRKLHPYQLTDTGARRPPKADSRGRLPLIARKEKMSLARLCREAENEFVGVNCGLLDQVSCLFGKEGHALELDCLHETVSHHPLIGDFAIVLFDSGVRHQLVASEYNLLRHHCELAARKLGVKFLRMIDPPALLAQRYKLTPTEYRRASHVVSEIQRVSFATRVLRENDLAQFGQFMFQSHESSRDLMRNSCPELDKLVELAQGAEGCLGARLTGGGFGGATLNLVERSHLQPFLRRVQTGFNNEFGRVPAMQVCRTVSGPTGV